MQGFHSKLTRSNMLGEGQDRALVAHEIMADFPQPFQLNRMIRLWPVQPLAVEDVSHTYRKLL